MFSNYFAFIGENSFLFVILLREASVDCPIVMLFGEGRLAELACKIQFAFAGGPLRPKTKKGRRKSDRNNFIRQLMLRWIRTRIFCLAIVRNCSVFGGWLRRFKFRFKLPKNAEMFSLINLIPRTSLIAIIWDVEHHLGEKIKTKLKKRRTFS